MLSGSTVIMDQNSHNGDFLEHDVMLSSRSSPSSVLTNIPVNDHEAKWKVTSAWHILQL
jgi:hypothetical protein